mmetsp:Transcript_23218/g.75626  ORF Transcript_23218/g.75626 Transcript_23218/m.75626 type:complete len:205 (+) Transcript_23218:476-1090(+)
MLWNPPALMLTTPCAPDTSCGTTVFCEGDSMKSNSLLTAVRPWPHVQTSPFSTKAKECIPPAATCKTLSRKPTLTGAGIDISLNVGLLCPCSFPPNANNSPCSSTASACHPPKATCCTRRPSSSPCTILGSLPPTPSPFKPSVCFLFQPHVSSSPVEAIAALYRLPAQHPPLDTPRPPNASILTGSGQDHSFASAPEGAVSRPN